MHVLFFDHCGTFGGGGRSLYEIIKNLKNRGVKTTIVAQKGEMAEAYKNLGINVIKVNGIPEFDNGRYSYYRGWRWLILFREFWYFIIFIPKLIEICKINHYDKFDILHFNDYSYLPAVILGYLFVCKNIIIHCRCMQRNSKNSFRETIIGKIYKKMNAKIVAIDKPVESTIPKYLDEIVIHNLFNPKNKLGEDNNKIHKDINKITIGFIGSISLMKGIKELIIAASMLKSTGCNFEIVIAGAEEPIAEYGNALIKNFIGKYIKGEKDIRKTIKNIIEKNGLEQNIKWLGYISELSSFYENIDLICFPSRLNAPGRPIFEAAYFSKPSIVAIDRSWEDTIINNRTGIIVKENTPSQIADAIMFFYHNKEKLYEFGLNAHELVKHYYGEKENIDKLMKCYIEKTMANSIVKL